MRMLLPLDCIKIQPIKVTNKIKVEHYDHAKATRNKDVEVEHDKPKKS